MMRFATLAMSTQAVYGFSVEYVRPRLISKEALTVGRADLPLRQPSVKMEDLPESFDARTAWPQCPSISDIWDQGACGDCWAVSAVTAAADRLCIAGASGNGDAQVRLSVEHMVGCCHTCGYGCGDGFPNYAWQWLAGQKGSPYGVVTGGMQGDNTFCSAYTVPVCSHYNSNPALPECQGHPAKTPTCPTACDSNSSSGKAFDDDRHQFASAYAISSTEAEIMAEIQAHGPITAGFNVYSDWVGYKSGVYTVQGGEELGGHAVVIIGWGTEDGKKYWLVRNSFGKAWGDEGYFKIQRFRGSCGIEQSLVAGLYASEALV